MRVRLLALLSVMALLGAACSSGGDPDDTGTGVGTPAADPDDSGAGADTDTDDAAAGEADADPAADDPVAVEPGTVVRLQTHDSFLVSDGLFDHFTAETGIEVEVLQSGDAGELVARAILTAGEPEADVLFGIDNTFLQRGLDADLFVPHQSTGLASVPDELELDPQHRVTPIMFGDVCVNYWTDRLESAPTSLDDLVDPALASSFVTQDPETSSPGFAFLLATIATYGDDGWEDYWRQLTAGGVTVTSGWIDAYYGEFVSGGGDKALVTSYASSPVAEVIFATEAVDSAPTGVLLDSCFRQIEFAGILAGADQPEAAGLLIDFMLSETFQADVPLNMFVAPANADVPLPESFAAHAVVVTDPLTLPPAEIEANRSDWTARWAEIVLR